MKIELNHRLEEIPSEMMTVDELLQWKNFTFKMLVIRINDELVLKDTYGSTYIHDGDRVMVLHLISGG